jgi:hypothetical protein
MLASCFMICKGKARGGQPSEASLAMVVSAKGLMPGGASNKAHEAASDSISSCSTAKLSPPLDLSPESGNNPVHNRC